MSEEDVPYNYNERANISLLAAGAWRSGAVALEEYPTKKKALKKRKGANHASGRCDLFVCVKRKYEFQIEAKQGWISASFKDQTIKNRIAKWFNLVSKDANRNTEGSGRVGCVFMPVFFRSAHFPKYKGEVESCIKQKLQMITGHEAHLWAWCFPKAVRFVKQREEIGDNRYWPGVIIGMKVGTHFKL